MNKKTLLLVLILVVLWLWFRKKGGESSVNMTSDGGDDILQECRYSNGRIIDWPVRNGPCPLNYNDGEIEGTLLISSAGISRT